MKLKKTHLIILGSFLVGILAFGGYSIASDTGWKKISDRSILKVFQDEEGTVIDFDTTYLERQSNEKISSNEKQSGKINTKGKFEKSDKEIKVFHVGGRDIEFTIDKKSGVAIFDESQGNPLFLTQPKNKNIATLVVDNDLYLLNLSSGKSEMVSKTAVEGYDKKQLLMIQEEHHEDEHSSPILMWVSNPKINPNGTQIAYESNRRGFGGLYHIDLWLLDLKSGQESILVEDAQPFDWFDQDQLSYGVYTIQGEEFAGIVNTKSNDKKQVKVMGFYGIADEKVLETRPGGLTFHSFNGDMTEVTIEGAETVSAPEISPDRKKAAVFFHVSPTKMNIAVLDIEKMLVDRIVYPPSDYAGVIHFAPNGKLIVSDLTFQKTWVEE